jgi:hypothetical protein
MLVMTPHYFTACASLKESGTLRSRKLLWCSVRTHDYEACLLWLLFLSVATLTPCLTASVLERIKVSPLKLCSCLRPGLGQGFTCWVSINYCLHGSQVSFQFCEEPMYPLQMRFLGHLGGHSHKRFRPAKRALNCRVSALPAPS